MHPGLVLSVGLMVTASFSVGLGYLNITTDPVELWASPHSRSRVEKTYFDEHFEPFYRVEQIILTSVGLPKVSNDDGKKNCLYSLFGV